jgi:hypothetical protein
MKADGQVQTAILRVPASAAAGLDLAQKTLTLRQALCGDPRMHRAAAAPWKSGTRSAPGSGPRNIRSGL